MDLIDLTKKVEVVLDLRKISPTIKAQVCLAVDGSGSMSNLYANGIVQKTVDRISAIAVKFDDNEELDVMVFSDGVTKAKSATTEMFGSYVKSELIDKRLVPFCGTNFAPFINQVMKDYFSKNDSVSDIAGGIMSALKDVLGFGKKEKPKAPEYAAKSNSGYPIFVICITDGQNSDIVASTCLLTAMQDKDIYWQFVGIGNERFAYCEKLARDLPNVGFFKIDNLETVKDMELYKNLMSEEFALWINKFK
jgi:hypothetical protein